MIETQVKLAVTGDIHGNISGFNNVVGIAVSRGCDGMVLVGDFITSGFSTHTMRHTCATHMIKNGAPVRHLQEMLGHESLESTQIYTQVSINGLKEVHAKIHPGDSLLQVFSHFKTALWGFFSPIVTLTDQEEDAGTGLYNYDARLYDQVINRDPGPGFRQRIAPVAGGL